MHKIEWQEWQGRKLKTRQQGEATVPLAIDAKSSEARRARENCVGLATLALLKGPILIVAISTRIVKRGERRKGSGSGQVCNEKKQHGEKP